jgi:hypothetical protein
LTKARDISVAEYTPDPVNKSIFSTISFDELARNESNDGLAGG